MQVMGALHSIPLPAFTVISDAAQGNCWLKKPGVTLAVEIADWPL
jgi:hypothetical protein